jgi:hypothetical protein
MVFLFFVFNCSTSYTQSLVKDFDFAFGATGSDYNVDFIRCSQGGYAVLAASTSDSSSIKSEHNRDSIGYSFDYWLIRFDDNGHKLWDRTYGGTASDVPSSLVEAPNGDFILGGTSASNIGFEKSEAPRGGNDFWILRVDSLGNVLWDKTIGGSANDNCKSVVITTYGDVFCGGYTLSSISGDKTSPSIGTQVAFDFWLVALSGTGQLLFDRTLGSIQNDNCNYMVATDNGGALMVGYSDGPAGFSKTQNSRGLNDFWVVSVDSLGKRIWDRTLGGTYEDYGYCALKTNDAFYIGGDSYSGIGADKTASNKGLDDMWCVKLSFSGNIIWDQSFGSYDSDEMNRISENSDGNILFSGESYSWAGFDKSENNVGIEQLWMILTDTSGNKIFDKTFFTYGHDEEGMAMESSPGNYIGCISTTIGIGAYKSVLNFGANDVWVCTLKPMVGIEENNESLISVFPNPVSGGQLHINSTANSGVVKMYDLRGVELKSANMIKGENFLFDVTGFDEGIYFLKFQSGDRVYTQRVVIISQ